MQIISKQLTKVVGGFNKLKTVSVFFRQQVIKIEMRLVFKWKLTRLHLANQQKNKQIVYLKDLLTICGLTSFKVSSSHESEIIHFIQ